MPRTTENPAVSFGIPAPQSVSVSAHGAILTLHAMQRTPHAVRLAVSLTNTGSSVLWAAMGAEAQLQTGQGERWPVNEEASANDFYAGINPGQTVSGWLVFPVSQNAGGPTVLMIPSLYRAGGGLWTMVLPLSRGRR